jgi:two-component system phosphate regulon sensor histidine kinase PhoR
VRSGAAWFLPGLAASAAAGLLVGVFGGAAAGWAVFSACLLALLLSQYSELMALYRWVSQPRLSDAPEREGLWGEVFNQLHRHRRANLRRRRELATLMVRSRRAVEALPYGVALLDAENRLQWCNETAHRHLGLDSARDLGQPVQNFVRQPEFARYLESGVYAGGIVLRVGAAGADSSIAVQLVVVDDDERLLLSNDVTGAERLEAMRRDFVANVSHELRTPLTVLAGFLETIRDLNLDADRVRDYTGLMSPQAERMKRIIDDLLVLSSLEHAPAPAPERVRVLPLLERVLGEARALSGGRHRIALQTEGAHDLAGAEGEITSAFLNLVTNAIRYTPEGGEIRLGWRSGREGASFTVEDTGIGIAPEHLPRLTERFYRVDRSRSRETGGTGLGLAIVKHALARHNATLDIRSEPGRGSVFSARFPESRLLAQENGEKVPG